MKIKQFIPLFFIAIISLFSVVKVHSESVGDFISFVTGNPGMPGDGIYVGRDNNFDPFFFILSEPYDLSSISNGLTVTFYPKVGEGEPLFDGNMDAARFRISDKNAVANGELKTVDIGVGFSPEIFTEYNGVDGLGFEFPRATLNQGVDEYNATYNTDYDLEDFVIVRITFQAVSETAPGVSLYEYPVQIDAVGIVPGIELYTQPSPTVTPTLDPTPTSTPSPTQTLTPTFTPSNTPTPTLTPTEAPTNTPIPTLTPNPYAKYMECGFTINQSLIDAIDQQGIEELVDCSVRGQIFSSSLTQVNQVLVGVRTDGKPMAWEVTYTDAIRPLRGLENGATINPLPDGCNPNDHRWCRADGWEWIPTGISNDGKVIALTAVNESGTSYTVCNNNQFGQCQNAPANTAVGSTIILSQPFYGRIKGVGYAYPAAMGRWTHDTTPGFWKAHSTFYPRFIDIAAGLRTTGDITGPTQGVYTVTGTNTDMQTDTYSVIP